MHNSGQFNRLRSYRVVRLGNVQRFGVAEFRSWVLRRTLQVHY